MKAVLWGLAAGLMTAAALLALLALAWPARAQSMPAVCGDRATIVAALRGDHGETKAARGLATGGGLVELFTAETGTWTLLLTLPGGPTCLMGVGDSWEDNFTPAETMTKGQGL